MLPYNRLQQYKPSEEWVLGERNLGELAIPTPYERRT